MTDPIMVSVASALATKAADMAADGVRSAMGALVRLVRSRFAGDKAAAAALDAAQAAPQDPELRAELSAGDGGTVNSNTGTVGGHLIQARDLHVEGELLLGDVQGPVNF